MMIGWKRQEVLKINHTTSHANIMSTTLEEAPATITMEFVYS